MVWTLAFFEKYYGGHEILLQVLTGLLEFPTPLRFQERASASIAHHFVKVRGELEILLSPQC